MSIKEFFKNDRFADLAGVELLEVELGKARAKMEVRDIHFNAGSVVQGGVIFTLADLAFAAAAHSYGYLTVSVETSIRYFKSVCSGILYADAEVVHLHRKLATFEVKITDEDKNLIALFIVTGYRKNIPLSFD